MSAVLDFPPIDAEIVDTNKMPAATSTALAKTDVKAIALARFGEWKPAAEAIVKKHKGVVFADLDTVKGYDALTKAIAEVRAPRFAAQNVSKASKSELAAVSKAVGAEEAAIAAFLEATEKELVAQKDAEDERRAAKKAADKAIEDARIAVHETNIAQIRSYAAQAAGKTSVQIATAIAVLESFTFGPQWEEFAVPAANANCETLEALRALHRITTEREQEALRAEAQRVELARVAAEQLAERNRLAEEKRQADARQKEADDKLAADRAEFEREKAEFAARQAAAAAPTVVPAVLTLATQEAAAEPCGIAFEQREPSPGTAALAPSGFPQVATPEGDKGPAAYDVQVADPIGSAIYLADGDIDSLLTDCLDLVTFAAAGLRTKQSAQKTTPEYWAGLRMRVDDLQPRLLAALEA